LRPLVGHWVTVPDGSERARASATHCSRSFTMFGKRWLRLEARWDAGIEGYRETAFFGAGADGTLAVYSFTSDGKKSHGVQVDGSDVHPAALAFESQMPAGLARMVYWPIDDGAPGFYFAVDNKVKAGWNRFLRHSYRPIEPTAQASGQSSTT
jgi:hypothetical protein